MPKYDDTRPIRCSFCGKTQDKVERMIAGPNGVYICNYCVDLCYNVVHEGEELEQKHSHRTIREEVSIDIPKPMEIKKILDDYVIGQDNAKKALSIADRASVLETGNIILEGDAKVLMNDERVKKAYLGE